MARSNGKHLVKSRKDPDLERLARIAPKKWRTQKALREAGFEKIPGGLSQAMSSSRLRRLGRQMQELRERAGLTRAQVARRMGVSVRELSELEQEDPGEMTLSVLESFARAVGADLRLSLQPAS